jgi:triacylglycerol lipase
MNPSAMYFPPGFDHTAAFTCAGLVGTAYDMYAAWVSQGTPRREQRFRWAPPPIPGFTFSQPIWSSERWLLFNESEPFGFTACTADGTGYLVFRGTDTTHDWLDDIHARHRGYSYMRNFGSVHEGFFGLFASMRADLDRALAAAPGVERWLVTGHSLGSALATLAIPYLAAARRPLAPQHYNFASPRTGDPAFAAAFDTLATRLFRMVNTSDVVTQLPLPVLSHSLYSHVGTPVDFTANYGTVAGNHSMTGAYLYALLHPDQPFSTPIAAQ